MTNQYRPGALGALMDEMERASLDLISIVENLPEEQFNMILDDKTEDEDCRSVKTIMTHVIRSGYGYANAVRRAFQIQITGEGRPAENPQSAIKLFNEMLLYTAQTLEGRWHMSYDEIDNTFVISRSGKKYDLEGILEHAVCHILRHRRQIEKLLSKKGMIA